MSGAIKQRKRCAVYCRVSSDERLDQSFNSIDAGFLDDGALQRVHSGIPDKLTMRFHSSARLRQ